MSGDTIALALRAAVRLTISTQYDALFRQHGGSIPVAYLRALAQRESGMNPRANAGKAAAQGLLQITTVAREAYNQRHGTSYTRDQSLDPDVNVRMATALLRNILTAYRKLGQPNLREDWGNPEFVRLLTAGWNAGYSLGGGVGKVVQYLAARGLPVTHAQVVASAPAAGAVSYLGKPDRAAWHRSVADLYFAQPDRPSASSLAGLALTAFCAWGAYRLLTRGTHR